MKLIKRNDKSYKLDCNNSFKCSIGKMGQRIGLNDISGYDCFYILFKDGDVISFSFINNFINQLLNDNYKFAILHSKVSINPFDSHPKIQLSTIIIFPHPIDLKLLMEKYKEIDFQFDPLINLNLNFPVNSIKCEFTNNFIHDQDSLILNIKSKNGLEYKNIFNMTMERDKIYFNFRNTSNFNENIMRWYFKINIVSRIRHFVGFDLKYYYEKSMLYYTINEKELNEYFNKFVDALLGMNPFKIILVY